MQILNEIWADDNGPQTVVAVLAEYAYLITHPLKRCMKLE